MVDRIEQLLNEIDQLKHYHKLEIENYTEDFNSVNKELKKSRNIIDQLVFSVYLSLKPGNGTHVKFGGYDEEGIEGGADRIRFLATDDSSSWSVPMSSVSIGDSQIEYDEEVEQPSLEKALS